MVRGFSVKKDGTRVPCNYDSHKERAWCESSDLYDAGLFEEAHKKLDEYHEINGGWINKHDWPFILKIEVGLLKVKPTDDNIENCKKVWNSVAFSCCDEHEILVDTVFDIVKCYAKANNIPMEWDGFDKASVEQTEKYLNFMLFFIRIGNDKWLDDLREAEFLDIFSMGMRHLIYKGENEKAQEFFDIVKDLSHYGKCFVNEYNPFKDDEDDE